MSSVDTFGAEAGCCPLETAREREKEGERDEEGERQMRDGGRLRGETTLGQGLT